MKLLLAAAVMALLPGPVTLKRMAKADAKAEYALRALIDLGGKDDIKFTGLFKEKIKSVESGKVTTATQTRVSVEVLGVVRQSGYLDSERVEDADGSLLTAAKIDPTLLFASPRIDRLRAFIFPAAPVEMGVGWWHTSKADDSMKAPPNSTYFKLEAEEKIGERDTWRISMDAREVDLEATTNVKGMLWLDKNDGSLVRGQWAINGFVLNATTPAMNARMELSRTD